MLSKADKAIITIVIISWVIILLNPPMAVFNHNTGYFMYSIPRDELPPNEARIQFSRLFLDLFTVSAIAIGIFVLKRIFRKKT